MSDTPTTASTDRLAAVGLALNGTRVPEAISVLVWHLSEVLVQALDDVPEAERDAVRAITVKNIADTVLNTMQRLRDAAATTQATTH